MKLTCVTAVFNAIKSGNRDKLIRCVESVAAINLEHEHLIYDGASQDGTVELLRELESKIPGLKVVSEPDNGIYNALNKGVRDARGEWFYVLGCDDYIHNAVLMARLISDASPYCDVLASMVRTEYHDGTFCRIRPHYMSQIYRVPCVCHQGEVLRTRLAREVGGFNEEFRIAADSDMFLKLHMAGRNFSYISDNFATFVYGGESSNNSNLGLKEHRISVANVLKLDGSARRQMIDGKVLPFKVCFKLWNHRDTAIRLSTRAMFRYRVILIIRKIFYPIVILTRPIRCALNRN